MKQILKFSFLALIWLFALPSSAENNLRIVLDGNNYGPIGEHILYFQERDKKLSVYEAYQVIKAGVDSKQSDRQSLAMGIGTEPVWLYSEIENNRNNSSQYRLTVETPWLDAIDVYFLKNGQVTKLVEGGDRFDINRQPMVYRTFAFETNFEPGVTELLIRVQTDSVMPIPVRLDTVEKAIERDIKNGYQYGILYGILIALSLYNAVLYMMIRQREFGIYSLYLLGFVVNSLTYTGVFFTIYTKHHGVYFQDYMNETLMLTYTVLGLHFARTVLRTKSYAPRLDKVTLWVANGFPILVLSSIALGLIYWSTIFAFLLNTCFAILFIVLGVKAVKHKVEASYLFLVSSVTASLCISISTAAVWGFLPYNDYTFKAIEVGMAFEAILLAVLLAQRFHKAQEERQEAFRVAHTDELTNLTNRRGFKHKIKQVWQQLVLDKKDVSVLLLDLDHFKLVNEKHGHAIGDIVLINVAKLLADVANKEDIVIRWGGEEFLIFMPNCSEVTAIERAVEFADRVKSMSFSYFERGLSVSISIGVCGTENGNYMGQPLSDIQVEHLISQADRALQDNKSADNSHISTATELVASYSYLKP